MFIGVFTGFGLGRFFGASAQGRTDPRFAVESASPCGARTSDPNDCRWGDRHTQMTLNGAQKRLLTTALDVNGEERRQLRASRRDPPLSTLAWYLICTIVAAFAAFATPTSAFADTAIETSPYMLVDIGQDTVLADRQAGQPWHPASLTKLMTAYVTFRAFADGSLAPDTTVTLSRVAAAQPAVRIGLRAGTKISMDDALKMMIVASANDIAVAVAETVGGNVADFVHMMNDDAQQLGMTRTHFENPTGLPADGQVSTAHDLAILARQLWVEFPDRRPLFGIQAIKSGRWVIHSPNLLLLERYPGAQGMKTGFTCASGYNLAVTATRGERTLLAIVLGRTSPRDRAELAARLLDLGFMSSLNQDAIGLAKFQDREADADPVDMQTCKGLRVRGAGFTTSALGRVNVVTDPVPVGSDEVAPAHLAKPASTRHRLPQQTAKSATTAAATKAGGTKPATTKPTAKVAVAKIAATPSAQSSNKDSGNGRGVAASGARSR